MPKFENIKNIIARVRFVAGCDGYAEVDVEFRELREGKGEMGLDMDHPLAYLQIRGRLNERDATPERPTYAWKYEYMDVYSADLRRCETMYKTLQWLDGRMKKLDQTHGYGLSFGTWLLRAINLIGVKMVIAKSAVHDSDIYFHPENFGELGSWIDHRCREKAEDWHNPKGWERER